MWFRKKKMVALQATSVLYLGQIQAPGYTDGMVNPRSKHLSRNGGRCELHHDICFCFRQSAYTSCSEVVAYRKIFVAQGYKPCLYTLDNLGFFLFPHVASGNVLI